MADRNGRTLTCPYCGVPVRELGPCAEHRRLAALDPFVGGMRGPLGERELGLTMPWPEGEAVDEGGDESEVAPSSSRRHDAYPNDPR